MIFKRPLNMLLNKSPFAINTSESADENLPNYFDALGKNSKYWILEERYVRNQMGFKTLLDSTLESVADAKIGDKNIQGVAVYEMLANVRYIEKFQYYPPFRESVSEEYIGDSDKVKYSLSLAFIKEHHNCSLNLSNKFRETLKMTSRNTYHTSKFILNVYFYLFII